MAKLYSALIMLSLIWGTSFLFIKILLEDLGPAAVVFGRCLFGTITLFILMKLQKKKQAKSKLPWKILFLVGLVNNALPWIFISLSETKISSGMASIINATTPIWTLIIGFLIFSTMLRKNQWLGIGIGFIGIFILSGIKIGDFSSGNTSGILLMIAATICYGLGAHLTKKYLAELSVVTISFYTLLFATMISFIFMIISTPESIPEFFKISHLLPLLGLGALGSGIAYILYYYLVKEGSAEFASLVTYLVPVSAVFWGAILLKEEIHLSMIAGLLIIFAGVYISSFKAKSEGKKKAAA